MALISYTTGDIRPAMYAIFAYVIAVCFNLGMVTQIQDKQKKEVSGKQESFDILHGLAMELHFDNIKYREVLDDITQILEKHKREHDERNRETKFSSISGR